jgi:hypothetical protein
MEQALQQAPPFCSFTSAQAALDVDLAEAPAPQIVTAVLAACSPDDVQEEELWALPVGVRLQCLLAILALEGERVVWVQLRCANPECGEPIEVELSPAELVALASEHAGDVVSVDAAGRPVPVRRPTGTDQLAWQDEAFADEGEARCAVVADLTGLDRPEVDDTLVQSVEDALTAADPLVSLEVDVVCPYCDERRPYEVDVLELVLGRLRRRQEELFAELHMLASHYHWTESEILAVPAERRARYLALVDLGRG